MNSGPESAGGADTPPGYPRPGPIVGREAQLSRLRTAVDAVRAQGQVLVVLGDAGMGKTVLLADAAQRARAAGLRVLWATARESEANLAFAGLHQLLSPVLDGAADLPQRQGQALRAALGLAAESTADRLVTGIAALTLLSDASERVPLLAVIDDAHWLDRSSLDILAFVSYRLRAERVVLLLGARGNAPPSGFDRGFAELRLEPLSAADARLLSGAPASRQAVSRILDLLENNRPPPSPGRGPRVDAGPRGLWIRACTDPFGSRNQLVPYLRRIARSALDEPALWRAGSAAWLLDESDLAIHMLLDAMRRLQAPGMRGTSGPGLTALGWAYIDTGRWDEALEVAAEAADLAEANHMDMVAASADVITAIVLAMRADSGAARRHAGRALASVDPAENGLIDAWARRALGVAALADGNYLLAFTQLRGLFSENDTPLHNYASYLGVADLAAAAVHADRRMEGRDVIERALSHLHGMASPRLEQLIARARGILADPAKSEAYFVPALSDPAGDQWPFERAQLRLDHAEWLRRRRRINDAKPVLTQALETFRRLRARSWAQRAEAELRACGVAVAAPHGARDALSELTPQQRQIVRLASDGLTNRQIGDRLFLSPRTVSTHLYRSYPKLGVAGRNQLRDLIARDGVPSAAHEEAKGETLL
jgi:ATP/maltotriose-dependent transcriptional regulator MalT